jgi:hypothetical protein
MKDVIQSHRAGLMDAIRSHRTGLKDVTRSHKTGLKDVIRCHRTELKDVIRSHVHGRTSIRTRFSWQKAMEPATGIRPSNCINRGTFLLQLIDFASEKGSTVRSLTESVTGQLQSLLVE